MGLALRQVQRGGRVNEAKNESGFDSASGFREAFTRIFGDPPTVAKDRPCLVAERIDTPLGTMLAVADAAGLRLLEFTDRRALERELPILRRRLRTNLVPGKHRHLDTIRKQLGDYFSGKRLDFDVPMAPVGSDFQMRTEFVAIDPDRGNTLLFVDGGAPRSRWRAARGGPGERHEHDLHRHSLSSRHPCGRNALRIRRWPVAEAMAARPRAAVREEG